MLNNVITNIIHKVSIVSVSWWCIYILDISLSLNNVFSWHVYIIYENKINKIVVYLIVI